MVTPLQSRMGKSTKMFHKVFWTHLRQQRHFLANSALMRKMRTLSVARLIPSCCANLCLNSLGFVSCPSTPNKRYLRNKSRSRSASCSIHTLKIVSLRSSDSDTASAFASDSTTGSRRHLSQYSCSTLLTRLDNETFAIVGIHHFSLVEQ